MYKWTDIWIHDVTLIVNRKYTVRWGRQTTRILLFVFEFWRQQRWKRIAHCSALDDTYRSKCSGKCEAGMHLHRFHYAILLSLQGQLFSPLVRLKTDFHWRPTAALQALDLKEACCLPQEISITNVSSGWYFCSGKNTHKLRRSSSMFPSAHQYFF